MSKLLVVENLSIQFGGLKAVDAVNFHINKSELLGLIGPNGAGKTTTLKSISGLVPSQGKLSFHNGQKILSLRAQES